MHNKLSGLLTLAVAMGAGSSVFAYDFWGVSVGSAAYQNSTHTTFDGVAASGAQYVVGGWKYTRVDGAWSDASQAPTPGEGYLASRKSDAQAIFFKADTDAANFVIIATSARTGQSATELGYDKRMFGPGDLKIDVGGMTLGVGLRLDDLLWAQDTSATQAQYQIYGTDNKVMNMHSRDAGTLGDIELDPTWGRLGNQDMALGSDRASAFYVSGSGTNVGSATVDYAYTGVAYNGAHVYAYSVSVPWEVLGQEASSYSFTASWRPDCGNDILSGDFSGRCVSTVPEPGTMAALAGGLVSLATLRRRY
ncbi:MAG: PEP-CTERM sorting domain-containing protein [Armatimonadota bacterium]|nr:PEP-CTERM sorting domain-containing protein [bacterium]